MTSPDWKDETRGAWKRGGVTFADGAFVFLSMQGRAYGRIAEAVCSRRHHSAPDPSCSCGFFAFDEPGAAVRFATDPAAALLMVTLAGRVLEGSSAGLRAARQRVEAVEWSPWCHSCPATAVALGYERRPSTHKARLTPLCSNEVHTPTVGLRGLAAALDVEMSWGTPNRWRASQLMWQQTRARSSHQN